MTRVCVYTDYSYTRAGKQVYAERAFALFVFRLAAEVDGLTLLGKIDPRPGPSHYAVPDWVDFRDLPYFFDVTDLRAGWRPMLGSLRTFWQALDEVDVVWLLGPHPLAVAFALIARLRGRPVVLGVRQDFRAYVRARHPGRRWVHRAGDALEALWGWLARSAPVIAVGPTLAAFYPRSRTLAMAVSLVTEAAVQPVGRPVISYDEPVLRALSVGRLEAEKNPLLLADVVASLHARGTRWELTVIGEGPMRDALLARAQELGVSDRLHLPGYLPWDEGLAELYGSSHALLHVSLTEGVPQVLYEAFAARLPVVATAVGGVAGAAGDAALLIAPSDADEAADALVRLERDPELRRALADAGTALVSAHTLEAEVARVHAFLATTAGR